MTEWNAVLLVRSCNNSASSRSIRAFLPVFNLEFIFLVRHLLDVSRPPLFSASAKGPFEQLIGVLNQRLRHLRDHVEGDVGITDFYSGYVLRPHSGSLGQPRLGQSQLLARGQQVFPDLLLRSDLTRRANSRSTTRIMRMIVSSVTFFWPPSILAMSDCAIPLSTATSCCSRRLCIRASLQRRPKTARSSSARDAGFRAPRPSLFAPTFHLAIPGRPAFRLGRC